LNLTLIIKSVLYRFVSVLLTFFVSLLITSDLQISLMVGVADGALKILYYYGFDLIWNKLTQTNFKPCVIWLTGLSGAGKTTIANDLFKKLQKHNVKCIILDGDEIRKCFSITAFDRDSIISHNINVGYMASLLEKQGYVVIVSLISPYRQARIRCRGLAEKFVEIYIATPLQVCKNRDVKGLYRKALNNEIKGIAGLDSPYEPPYEANVVLDTTQLDLETCTSKILHTLKNKEKVISVPPSFSFNIGSLTSAKPKLSIQ